MEKGVMGTSYLGNSFETINMQTSSHAADCTPAYDIFDDDFNENDWINKASDPRALDNSVVSLSTLELVEEQEYDQFCRLILHTRASDSSSEFNEGVDGILHNQHA